jgi:hypothetical protein
MDVNDRQVLNSLLTKLSAVRMTLSDEEQVLLDEVVAHRFAKVEAAVADADEVQAHRFAKVEAVAAEADEVQAHGFEIFYDDQLEAYRIR